MPTNQAGTPGNVPAGAKPVTSAPTATSAALGATSPSSAISTALAPGAGVDTQPALDPNNDSGRGGLPSTPGTPPPQPPDPTRDRMLRGSPRRVRVRNRTKQPLVIEGNVIAPGGEGDCAEDRVGAYGADVALL